MLVLLLQAREPDKYCAASRAAKIRAKYEAERDAANAQDTAEQRDALAKMLEMLQDAK
jgi:hypothetical protein